MRLPTSGLAGGGGARAPPPAHVAEAKVQAGDKSARSELRACRGPLSSWVGLIGNIMGPAYFETHAFAFHG